MLRVLEQSSAVCSGCTKIVYTIADNYSYLPLKNTTTAIVNYLVQCRRTCTTLYNNQYIVGIKWRWLRNSCTDLLLQPHQAHNKLCFAWNTVKSHVADVPFPCNTLVPQTINLHCRVVAVDWFQWNCSSQFFFRRLQNLYLYLNSVFFTTLVLYIKVMQCTFFCLLI